MTAFKKFDPTPYLLGAANTAKAANETPKLATLAGLAGAGVGDSQVALEPWTEEVEERAAIIEHDGGVRPEWAEALARICHTAPPPHISTERWRLFIDDCARFLDDGWADHATALGWKPREVFGCDSDGEFADVRPDGLMWITGGAKLIALSSSAAALITQVGVRRTYRRSPITSGAMLAWRGPLEDRNSTP
jgi:hypothetical protein